MGKTCHLNVAQYRVSVCVSLFIDGILCSLDFDSAYTVKVKGKGKPDDDYNVAKKTCIRVRRREYSPLRL
ncbi:hypothetical protein U1Q18_052155, partial [Sarracenia purpurea var. burkii]